jgi:hypothetical protein
MACGALMMRVNEPAIRQPIEGRPRRLRFVGRYAVLRAGLRQCGTALFVSFPGIYSSARERASETCRATTNRPWRDWELAGPAQHHFMFSVRIPCVSRGKGQMLGVLRLLLSPLRKLRVPRSRSGRQAKMAIFRLRHYQTCPILSEHERDGTCRSCAAPLHVFGENTLLQQGQRTDARGPSTPPQSPSQAQGPAESLRKTSKNGNLQTETLSKLPNPERARATAGRGPRRARFWRDGVGGARASRRTPVMCARRFRLREF